MARRDRHTRIVGWLKIALPLAALAILSTLFLFSRRVPTPADLPFAQVEMEERARRQQVTRPSLAGATDAGDLIVITAEEVRPDPEVPEQMAAVNVAARIDFVAGSHLTVRSDQARFDRDAGIATLDGDVIGRSSSGHEIRTDRVEIGTSTRFIRADGPVRGSGPEGTWTAGGMELSTDVTSGDIQLVFTGGVKLIYDPRNFED